MDQLKEPRSPQSKLEQKPPPVGQLDEPRSPESKLKQSRFKPAKGGCGWEPISQAATACLRSLRAERLRNNSL